jgi:hypothetical protein
MDTQPKILTAVSQEPYISKFGIQVAALRNINFNGYSISDKIELGHEHRGKHVTINFSDKIIDKK